MASSLFYLAFLTLAVTVFAGEKVIRIIPGNSNELEFLSSLEDKAELELDFWKAPHKVGLAVDIHVTEDAYKILTIMLKEQSIQFQIVIFDVEKMVDEERSAVEARGRSSGFSYSNYHRLEEIVAELRNLKMQNSKLASRRVFSVGNSYEGRVQQAIELKGKQFPGKKVFFMNCGIHAREWVSPATCMYIIKQIVSKYGNDPSVTAMLDKMDFVIMPVLNVDGYKYTWSGRGRKYRFWRKTRKPNPQSWRGCIGTDPNRNWGHKWGLPGASSDPCNDAYRGTRPFSEVEVKNVANYLYTRKEQIAGYMDIHAYSQLWMIPLGYTTRETRDHRELMRVSNKAIQAIRSAGYGTYYKAGQSSVIIYKNSGGSKDYTYGELGIKYSFALELRDTGRYGFMLPANQIVPTGMETFEGIKAMAQAMRV